MANSQENSRAPTRIGHRPTNMPVSRGVLAIKSYALVDKRRLERECFVRCIELLYPRVSVIGYASAEDCVTRLPDPVLSAIIYNMGHRYSDDACAIAALEMLLSDASFPPVVVLAEHEDFDEMMRLLDMGAAGYVPATVGIESVLEATKLAASGGIFLTTESIAQLRGTMLGLPTKPIDALDLTSTQLAVAEGLRRGKSNRAMAKELDLWESTVKAHIQEIFRKLQASNRTEAAYKLNHFLR